MKVVADENVDMQIVERLRQEGHEVTYIAEVSPAVTDDELISQTNEQNCLFVTADKDFGELVFRQGRVHAGVILVRPLGISPSLKADLVIEALREHGDQMRDAFTVISPGIVRIRRSH